MDTIKRIKYKTNNCYLIVNDVKAVLVDTCSGGAYETVVKECSNYDMQLIVLTHIHFDHAENAARLSEYFHIPVAFHEADINLFKSYDSQPLKSYGIVGKTVLGISLGTLRNNRSTWYEISGIDFEGGDSTVFATSWKSGSIDISAYKNQSIKIRFLVYDVGDSAYDSAVLIDNVVCN